MLSAQALQSGSAADLWLAFAAGGCLDGLMLLLLGAEDRCLAATPAGFVAAAFGAPAGRNWDAALSDSPATLARNLHGVQGIHRLVFAVLCWSGLHTCCEHSTHLASLLATPSASCSSALMMMLVKAAACLMSCSLVQL